MNEQPSSSAIFEALAAGATDRRREALSRLKAACDHIAKGGQIKLAAIEEHIRRTAGSEMGPRAQSISNERSRPLGMYHYVVARNRERALVARHDQKRKNSHDMNRIIDSIVDMDVRLEMRDMYDRMQVAEANYARAKHVLKTLKPGVDIDALLCGRSPSAIADDTRSLKVLESLTKILTDNERLMACGLCYEDGIVRRRVGTRDQLIGVDIMQELIAKKGR